MPSDSSRSTRILILLLIDSAFFLLELIAGYSLGSLALVADSFHMLNDVCSLLVALYAIKLAGGSKRSHEYSYGWQRAEILGALINGVFLLALCFSIFLEAIQRAFEPVDIKSPLVVVLVGSLGLASNIVGLLLFHEHGHSHGHSNGHSHHSHSKPAQITPHDAHHHHPIESHPAKSISPNEHTPLLVPSAAPDSSQLERQSSTTSLQSYDSSPDQDPSLARKTNLLLDEICVHPAQTRNNILRAAELKRDQLNHHQHNRHHASSSVSQSPGTAAHPDPHTSDVEAHAHSHSHSHSHSHMNMRAIFLHALGDALGNVGVIMTGLLIWLVPRVDQHGNSLGNRWVLYADPAISLVITVIIFTSALPLVRSASLILLQGTPPNIDLGRVQTSIQAIQGVLQVHELHIWSLSESKLVASVHVLIKSQADFVSISRHIRRCLHQYGIHSSTIQPEILMQEQIDNIRAKSLVSKSRSPSAQSLPEPTSVEVTQTLIDADGCLVQCDETCDQEACCPPGIIASSAVGEEPSTSSATG